MLKTTSSFRKTGWHRWASFNVKCDRNGWETRYLVQETAKWR